MSECQKGTLPSVRDPLVSGNPEACCSELERGESLEHKGEEEEEEEVSESEGFPELMFQQRPESPNMKSDKSSVLVESRVLSVLQEPSSELLLIREELSLDESSSSIFCSWGYLE